MRRVVAAIVVVTAAAVAVMVEATGVAANWRWGWQRLQQWLRQQRQVLGQRWHEGVAMATEATGAATSAAMAVSTQLLQ